MGSGGSAHKAEGGDKGGEGSDDLESKDVDELTQMAYAQQATGEYRESALAPSLKPIGSDMHDMYGIMHDNMIGSPFGYN